MNILFIGAHTDDIEHGAGGLFCQLLKEREHQVRYLTFSKCMDLPRNEGIEVEIRRVGKYITQRGGQVRVLNLPNRRFPERSLEIRTELEHERATFHPEIIFTHWVGDIHQDHKVVAEESLRVFRNETVLACEGLRSCPRFAPNFFVVLSEEAIDTKIELLAMYETQAGLYYNSPDVIRSLAVARGVAIGRSFAEGYSLERMVVGEDACALLL